MTQQLALQYEPSPAALLAQVRQRVSARLDLAAHTEEQMIKRVADTVIVDLLAYGNEIIFTWGAEGRLRIHYKGHGGKDGGLTLHRHALNGLASTVGVPAQYVTNLLKGAGNRPFMGELLAHTLNQLFHRTPELSDTLKGAAGKFLHRTVNGELRAFLTSKYNTNVASLPTLRAFVSAARAVNARFLDGHAGVLRNTLKAFQEAPREVSPGKYLVFGVTWTNSDFGAGSLSIAQTLWDPNTNTRIVLDASYKKVHLGGVRQGDGHALSNNALRAETEAVAAAVDSAVSDLLSAQSIEATLVAVRAAQEKSIDWRTLRTRLKDFLYANEIDTISSFFEEGSQVVTTLTPPGRDFDGNVVASRWWAASLIGEMASQTPDLERRAELEREAGRFLNEFFKEE